MNIYIVMKNLAGLSGQVAVKNPKNTPSYLAVINTRTWRHANDNPCHPFFFIYISVIFAIIYC